MRPRLNLATAPLENHRRFLLGASFLGLLALGVMAVLVVTTYRGWRANRDLRIETSRLQSELQQFRTQRRELEDFFKLPETRQVMDRAGFLNALIEQRAFPWTRVFMDLERQLPIGVRVVSIAPRMEAGRVEVKLSVGASSDESKLKLLKALQGSPQFSRFQVTSEMRPTRQEEGDRVMLDLIIWYQSVDAPAAEGAPPAGRPAGK